MGDPDEGTRLHRPAGEVWATLRRATRREVGGQTYGEDVPIYAQPRLGRVQLGREEGGEALAARGARVRYGEAVALSEVVGDREEIVASLSVEPGEFLGEPSAVGIGGVGVEVAPVEASRLVEGEVSHENVRYHPSTPGSRSDAGNLANPHPRTSQKAPLHALGWIRLEVSQRKARGKLRGGPRRRRSRPPRR